MKFKPRIYWTPRLCMWACWFAPTGKVGFGKTPARAFKHWESRQ